MLKLRVQWESRDVEKREERKEPSNAVDRGEEDKGASWVAQEEIVEVRVLVA